MALVVKDFWAPWCGPCRVQEPIIEEIEHEFSGKIKLEKINVDENPDEAGKYGVMSIPTIVVEKDGTVLKQFIGVTPKETLKEILDENI